MTHSRFSDDDLRELVGPMLRALKMTHKADAADDLTTMVNELLEYRKAVRDTLRRAETLLDKPTSAMAALTEAITQPLRVE